jgi:hypothetical protein
MAAGGWRDGRPVENAVKDLRRAGSNNEQLLETDGRDGQVGEVSSPLPFY